MKSIAFIDTEIEPKNGRIRDIGSVKSDGNTFHSPSVAGFVNFLHGAEYVCGHNVFNHDLKYIGGALHAAGINDSQIIDTLFLSPLLFPAKPYHALLKDDKLQTEDVNNPLNDAIKARDLFYAEVTDFQQADSALKQIYYYLLKDRREFCSFFYFLGLQEKNSDGNGNGLEILIWEKFQAQICEHANLSKLIADHPVELAYCLALINTNSQYSITPPWVLKNYPAVERIMFLLRSNPCLTGCSYCEQALDIHKGLKQFFGFDSYRTYAGEPLQERAGRAAARPGFWYTSWHRSC